MRLAISIIVLVLAHEAHADDEPRFQGVARAGLGHLHNPMGEDNYVDFEAWGPMVEAEARLRYRMWSVAAAGRFSYFHDQENGPAEPFALRRELGDLSVRFQLHVPDKTDANELVIGVGLGYTVEHRSGEWYFSGMGNIDDSQWQSCSFIEAHAGLVLRGIEALGGYTLYNNGTLAAVHLTLGYVF